MAAAITIFIYIMLVIGVSLSAFCLIIFYYYSQDALQKWQRAFGGVMCVCMTLLIILLMTFLYELYTNQAIASRNYLDNMGGIGYSVRPGSPVIRYPYTIKNDHCENRC